VRVRVRVHNVTAVFHVSAAALDAPVCRMVVCLLVTRRPSDPADANTTISQTSTCPPVADVTKRCDERYQKEVGGDAWTNAGHINDDGIRQRFPPGVSSIHRDGVGANLVTLPLAINHSSLTIINNNNNNNYNNNSNNNNNNNNHNNNIIIINIIIN
jgi:hypothetical protein